MKRFRLGARVTLLHALRLFLTPPPLLPLPPLSLDLRPEGSGRRDAGVRRPREAPRLQLSSISPLTKQKHKLV